MTISPRPLKTAIVYPDSDGAPMAESDPTRDYLIYGVETLKQHFQNREDVYVSGNLFIYYQQGVPSAVVAPDVFVIFGVPNHPRMSYKAWKEQDKLPDFILEITSKTTQAQDEQDKPIKYAHLGVKEYFQYDPSSDYLKPCLKGRRLVEGKYQEIESTLLEDETVSIYSAVLGLELRIMAGELRFYDPSTDTLYPNYTEMAVRLKQMGIKLGVTENALLQSENALLQSENALLQSENALLQSENARIEADNARNEAENARIEAENARIEAENARIEAENARIEAESARIEAENARIKAESERQEIRERLNQAIKTLQNLGLSQEEIATTLNLPLAQVQEYCTQG